MYDQIQLLKWMLEDIRKETLEGVKHLTKEQLFQNPIEGEYPIGAYLMHIADCEIDYLEFLTGIQQSEELKKSAYMDKWYRPDGEPSPPKKALEVNEYLGILATTRKNFLDYISTLNDYDLEEIIVRKGQGGEISRFKKELIFYSLEHEVHHRGQMFMLIRKAGWNKK
ncbi:MAG: DinB family protein [Bacteroidota bacterium]|nr:DinB family protein [Bacteroidota bacterium]